MQQSTATEDVSQKRGGDDRRRWRQTRKNRTLFTSMEQAQYSMTRCVRTDHDPMCANRAHVEPYALVPLTHFTVAVESIPLDIIDCQLNRLLLLLALLSLLPLGCATAPPARHAEGPLPG